MENFILSLNVVLPLFLIMAVGYLLRRIGLLDDAVLPKLNSLVFKAFLPMMLFNNIYHSDLESMMNPKLILTAVVSILVIFGVLCLVIPRIEKDGPRRGAMVQGIFRSNYIIFGVPIVSGVFGEQGLGVVSILSAFAIPLFNVLSVVALEIFSHGTVNKNRIVKGIVTNPLIIASLLGVVFLLAGIPIPTPVEEALADMSAIATPLGLVSLGGFFRICRYQALLKAADHRGGGPLGGVPGNIPAGLCVYGFPRCGPDGTGHHDGRPHRSLFLYYGPAAGGGCRLGGPSGGLYGPVFHFHHVPDHIRPQAVGPDIR